jgi:hypothetical protein
MRIRPIASIRLLALLCALCGCARDRAPEPTTGLGPLESSSIAGQLLGSGGHSPHGGSLIAWARLSYPLQIGNRWEYVVRSSSTVIGPGGPEPPSTYERGWVTVITDVERWRSRDYYRMLEYDADPRVQGPPFGTFSLLREDAGGLYAADLPVFGPDGRMTNGPGTAATAIQRQLDAAVDRARGTAAHRAAFHGAAAQLAAKVAALALGPGIPTAQTEPNSPELTLLRYPLFVGARWPLRVLPLFERAVTGRERVRTPAGSTLAWRVQATPPTPFTSSDDRIEYWYSNAGLIRNHARLSVDVVDVEGNVIGTMVYDSDQRLTAVRLVDPALPRALAAAP